MWERIEHLHRAAGTSSRTGAMRDAYALRETDISEAMTHFPLIDGQNGLLVIIGGHAVGLDLVSRHDAYADLHDKLTRSYVMDSLIRHRRGCCDTSSVATERVAREFIAHAVDCRESRHESVGMGSDYRFGNGEKVGSALVVSSEPVHCAFFHLDGGSSRHEQRLAGYRRRRSYRM